MSNDSEGYYSDGVHIIPIVSPSQIAYPITQVFILRPQCRIGFYMLITQTFGPNQMHSSR